MGGFGSGRWGFGGGKPTCEGCHSIDLAWLRRRGMLEAGRWSTLTWSRGGRQTGSITIVAQHDGVRLKYRINDHGGTPVNVDELVPFTYTTTKFNGRRQWLQCLKCGRGCRKIYGGRYFRCRQCHGLVHASTREPSYQRTLDRADRIRKRLCDTWGSAFEGDEFPPKPKRMRWKTYRRLEERYEDLQNQWAVGAMVRFGFIR